MMRVGRARSRSYAMSAPSWRPSRSRGATSRATRSLIARGPARTTWTCWSHEWMRIASRRSCIAWASSWPGADGRGSLGSSTTTGTTARPALWSTYTRTFSSSSATTSRRATGCRSRRLPGLGPARRRVLRPCARARAHPARHPPDPEAPDLGRNGDAPGQDPGFGTLGARRPGASLRACRGRAPARASAAVRPQGDLRRLPAGARARCRKVRRDPRRRAPAGRSHACGRGDPAPPT